MVKEFRRKNNKWSKNDSTYKEKIDLLRLRNKNENIRLTSI